MFILIRGRVAKINSVNTSAAIIDKDGADAIDVRGEFTALAVCGVRIRLYRGIETLARRIGVEMDCGCGRDDEDAG